LVELLLVELLLVAGLLLVLQGWVLLLVQVQVLRVLQV
jgi:hypothetical protein